MSPKALNTIREALAVPLVVSVDLVRHEMIRCGSCKGVVENDLVDVLFRDMDAAVALNRSLEGRLLPQLWRQGSVSCVLCKPVDDVLVGLFTDKGLDAIQMYWWSKEAEQVVRQALLI